MKIALGIEYNGSDFRGWQKQKNALNIQGHVELALSKVADQPIEVVCAGRTDAGVHALGQVVHFETSVVRDNRSWVLGANGHLPKTIAVRWARPQPEDFHARFGAIARRYCYLLCCRGTKPAVFHDHMAWHYKALDVGAMKKALPYFLGEHDFSAFRAADCQAKTTSRNIQAFSIHKQNDTIIFDIKANAFLYHMVRNIVGTLMKVGLGDESPEWIASVIASKDRCQAGVTAPANGLYFMNAFYPERFDLPRIDNGLFFPVCTTDGSLF